MLSFLPQSIIAFLACYFNWWICFKAMFSVKQEQQPFLHLWVDCYLLIASKTLIWWGSAFPLPLSKGGGPPTTRPPAPPRVSRHVVIFIWIRPDQVKIIFAATASYPPLAKLGEKRQAQSETMSAVCVCCEAQWKLSMAPCVTLMWQLSNYFFFSRKLWQVKPKHGYLINVFTFMQWWALVP